MTTKMLNAFEIKNRILFSDCEEIYTEFEKIIMKTQENISVDQIMIECSEHFVHLLFKLYNKVRTMDETMEEAQKVKMFVENNIERELTMKEIADSIYRSRDYTN